METRQKQLDLFEIPVDRLVMSDREREASDEAVNLSIMQSKEHECSSYRILN